ncbi:hypothetical protein FE257_001692 [Aspergillus nanangensis]|uniref:Uncharacterized protein n=1 Tax=Aspergillus nanangensis TaxID=2582783 RepID=A0AAD4CDJ6_ASPNN|nr:hypothetical protein FE257_001692 [Aspergillus nanangensis]
MDLMEDRDIFPESLALNSDHLDILPGDNNNNNNNHLPDEPLISLNPHSVHEFLTQELSTPLLDELYPRLWLAARRTSSHIDALHRQRIKGRTITPSEDPKLHLVWQTDRIYIKPIPTCLLNYTVWTTFLRASKDADPPDHGTPSRALALGFLRSYGYLIRHKVDFVLAQEAHLIAPEITWVRWGRFIAWFRGVEDGDVAKRYHYGQLRLSRLQWMVRVGLAKNSSATGWFYEVPYWSIASYVRQAATPLLFLFASLSVVLGAMQVVVSVEVAELGFVGGSALKVHAASWVFSVVVLVATLGIWLLIFVIPLGALVWQVSWALANDAGVRGGEGEGTV